jgi:hypothetical protein
MATTIVYNKSKPLFTQKELLIDSLLVLVQFKTKAVLNLKSVNVDSLV